MQGGYFPYRYPFKEELLQTTVMAALNIPIYNPEQQILSKLPEYKLEREREQEDKENRLRKQMENLTKEEQRKIERERKKQKKLEADLEPERMLNEEMETVKRKVGTISGIASQPGGQ